MEVHWNEPIAFPWRTGRSVGRTIYAMTGEDPSKRDILIGLMDDCALADEVVRAHNESLERAKK